MATLVSIYPGNSLKLEVGFNYAGPPGNLAINFWIIQGGVEKLYRQVYPHGVPASPTWTNVGVATTFSGGETAGLPSGAYQLAAAVYWGSGAGAVLLANLASDADALVVLGPVVSGLTWGSFIVG